MNPTYPLFACILLGCALCPSLLAQSANDLNEGFKLKRDNETDSFTLSWWGRSGFIYFLEQSSDLKKWTYVPVSHLGAGGPIQYGFNSNAERAFFRLRLTDDPTAELWKGDFDGDGVCNGNEVLAGMNPFRHEPLVDSDNDGLPDHWEIAYFGNLAQDGEDSFLGDGIRNREKYQYLINPTTGVNPASESRTEYAYDATGRLVQVSTKSVTILYTLDNEGNILSAH